MFACAEEALQNSIEIGEQLAERAGRGDEAAFAAIFELHSRFVYKFVFAMTGDRATAEELTQETFLAAYRGIGNLRGESNLRTWLCAIAKNTVYKSFRARRKENINGGGALIESLAATTASQKSSLPDAEFLNRELNDAIRRALTRLDADKRLVFALKELQNLSYKQISEITGASVPKLKTDLHRAKIEMRRALQPYLNEKQ